MFFCIPSSVIPCSFSNALPKNTHMYVIADCQSDSSLLATHLIYQSLFPPCLFTNRAVSISVSDTWRPLPPLPRPMLFCTGLPFGDSFLVSGSFANNDEVSCSAVQGSAGQGSAGSYECS